MSLRQAAQQALEALEKCSDWPGAYDACSRAVDSLRAALTEPEQPTCKESLQVQEPIAWMVYTDGGTSAYVTDNPNDLIGAYRALPLYTAPTPRKPLTDEELEPLLGALPCYDIGNSDLVNFARAIERAHGITGETK